MFKFIMPSFFVNVEKWKWNNEYKIFVSNLGHFKDEYKNPIAVKLNSKGYVLIKTVCGLKLAHRLVMMTWMPTADMENLTVDHLDHNKRNNELMNLEWVTQEENWRRAQNDLIKYKGNIKTEEETINIIGLTKVACKDHIFNSTAEAAQFMIRENKIPTVKGLHKKVERRIKAAIEFDKEYFNTKWWYVVD